MPHLRSKWSIRACIVKPPKPSGQARYIEHQLMAASMVMFMALRGNFRVRVRFECNVAAMTLSTTGGVSSRQTTAAAHHHSSLGKLSMRDARPIYYLKLYKFREF
jgi:hypothetical protein